MPTLSLRLGSTLHTRVQAYCESLSQTMSKSQALQYVLVKYLEHPAEYSVLQVRELREPMAYSLSLTIPEKLQQQVSAFADTHNLKVSEVLRMALYQELIIHDSQS